MDTEIDIEKYFKRINYLGSKEPNLENLRALSYCHVTHIPFDTIDLFQGFGRSKSMPEIYQKLIEERRGGWCYELNGLFACLLTKLGYRVQILEGSSYKYARDGFTGAFDHVFLKTELDGVDWAVDVGYIGPSFVMPKRMEEMTEQAETTGLYRLRKLDEGDDTCYLVEKKQKQTYLPNDEPHQSSRNESRYSIDPTWDIVFKFSTKPYTWEQCLIEWEKQLKLPELFFRANTFLQLVTNTGINVLWGSIFIKIEFPDVGSKKLSFVELLPDQSSDSKEKLSHSLENSFGVTLDSISKLSSDHFKHYFRNKQYHKWFV